MCCTLACGNQFKFSGSGITHVWDSRTQIYGRTGHSNFSRWRNKVLFLSFDIHQLVCRLLVGSDILSAPSQIYTGWHQEFFKEHSSDRQPTSDDVLPPTAL